jgi:dolichol-phosphate mannosyltransferase
MPTSDSPLRAVPRHLRRELAPKGSRYALCIFVINEGERLLTQLDRLEPWSHDVDVIVADGGSVDGSTEPARLARLGVNTLLTKSDTGKLGSQMRMAFAFALERGYEGVIVMDGNNKDGPEAIPEFVRALESGVDHVQGSRFVPGGRAINTPPARYWGVRLLHAPVMSIASRFRYTDTTNGFRAYSRKFLTAPRVAVFREVFTSYELHYYLALQAARLDFQVREIPVTRAYPAHGPTPSKIHGLSGNLNILRTLWRVCTGQFNPTSEEIGNASAAEQAPSARRAA